MNKRISLTDDEQALLSAILDYTLQNVEKRIETLSVDKTELLALRYTRRQVEHLRDKIFPRPRSAKLQIEPTKVA